MSQIALGFACSEHVMAQANEFSRKRDTARMMATLRPFDIGHFDWSGYVIVIVVEWLKTRGIELPRASTPATSNLIANMDPLLCATKGEVNSLLEALRALHPTSEELARHWTEWTGESVPEALQFMPAGLAWLTSVVEAGTRNDWSLVLEG
jgi:hypothetical protein